MKQISAKKLSFLMKSSGTKWIVITGKKHFINEFYDSNTKLAELIGRDLSRWNT